MRAPTDAPERQSPSYSEQPVDGGCGDQEPAVLHSPTVNCGITLAPMPACLVAACAAAASTCPWPPAHATSRRLTDPRPKPVLQACKKTEKPPLAMSHRQAWAGAV